MIRRILVLLLAAVAGWAGAAGASGFHTAEYHAAQVGQATGGMTMTENAGVVATLPAAMVRVSDGANVLGGLTNFDPSFDATPTGSTTTFSTTTGNTIAPHFYYVQNRRDYAYGLGLYFPFNDVIEWPAGWPGATEVQKEEINVGYLSFSGAYASDDNLSFGGSLVYIQARANLQKLTDATASVPTLFVPTELDAEAERFGLNLSVMYDTDSFAVGLNHSPKYTLEGEGTLSFDRSAYAGFPLSAAQKAALDQAFRDRPATATLLMPAVTELGVAMKDRQSDPNWFAELTLLYTGWSNFSEIRIVSDDTNETTELIEKNWDDTLGIKLSGNYVVSRSGQTSHKLRGGLFIDESPIPAETLAPDVPDGEGRKEWAVGYGFKQGSLIVDAAYFVILFEDSTSTDPDFAASYSGEVAITTVSVGYEF